MFLLRCFVLLAVFIFAGYLSLRLHHDLSKASWYKVTESWKISCEEYKDESRDSIESGGCLMIGGVFYLNIFFFGKGDKLNFQGEVLHLISFSFSRYIG